MRTNEIAIPGSQDARLTMSYDRKKAEQKISGLEDPINEHLLKLMGFRAAPETRRVWKRELQKWFRTIAAIRVRDQDKTLPERDYFNWLYDEPFGGVEVKNVAALLAFLAEEFDRNAETPDAIAQRLEGFHEQLSKRFSAELDWSDLLDPL